jgi:hypothetical protein
VEKVVETGGIAFGVPLAVFTFGWSLLWALAGFRRTPDAVSLSNDPRKDS